MRSLVKVARASVLTALAWIGSATLAHAGEIGMLTLHTRADAALPAVPIVVWYPTTVPTTTWRAGPYELHGTRGAPVAPGPHALVIVSHGSGGSEFGHADLAEHLASRGYIVAAPRHLGDSWDQPEGRGSDVQIYGRPWQAAATLDAVLADARLRPAIDPKRIGMTGFSAGGYTTLVMSGARPDVARMGRHCTEHPQDAEVCPAGASTTLRITRPGWSGPDDHRVRAAVAMAPFSTMFDAKDLAGITVPLRLYMAQDDRVLNNAWNTERIATLLGARAERGFTLAGGHYVFLAPCSAEMASITPQICRDPEGVDRAAQHARLNDEIADFFDRTLPAAH